MKSFLLIPVCVVMAACSVGDSDERREPTVGAEVASDYNRQMNKAREVELQLDQQKRDLDAAIEASDPARREP